MEDKKESKAEDRLKVIAGLISTVQKEFGEGAMMVLGDSSPVNADCIPTGALSLDMALGPGGIPKGRVIEIYGPESSGKSTLCAAIVASAQSRGGICAYVDVENAFDIEYASAIGVNVDELLFSQPEYGEQALDITERLTASGAVSVIIVDSLAALIPKAEFEAESFEKQSMGLQARMMSQALRKLSGMASRSGTTIIFINQLREKIGVMFGNPETTPGGKALKFYASVRIDLRVIESIQSGGEKIGNKVRAKMVKNKIAPPFREAIFDIIFGKGIDRFGSILESAVALNLIEKSGSWFSHQSNRIGQGAEAAKAWLKENVSVADQLEAKIRDTSHKDLKNALDAVTPKKAKGGAPTAVEAPKSEEKKA